MNFKTISAKELERYTGIRNTIVIDLRSPKEYKISHVPTAVNIPYEQLEKKKNLIRMYDQIILYCERGGVSLLASRQLSMLGYSVINVAGGFHSYRGEKVN